MLRGEAEGLGKDPRLVTPGDYYFGKKQEFFMFKCAFYECFKCKKPFFGGLKECENEAMRAPDFNPANLTCAACSPAHLFAGQTECPVKGHGKTYIDFKCRHCCSVALFSCVGNRHHFCDPCHNDAIARRLKDKDCMDKNCPLHVKHPRAGTEFALGCGLCRSKKV